MAGRVCGNRLRERSRTSLPFLKARRRMPSSLRSKIHSGPSNRSYVSVAAMGSIHSGKDAIELASTVYAPSALLARPFGQGPFWQMPDVQRPEQQSEATRHLTPE